jgi:hypothetical protein
MAQRRYGAFRQKPHVQKADCQLAAKGSADAGMEVSIQDRPVSAGRSAGRLISFAIRRYSSGPLNFAAH